MRRDLVPIADQPFARAISALRAGPAEAGSRGRSVIASTARRMSGEIPITKGNMVTHASSQALAQWDTKSRPKPIIACVAMAVATPVVKAAWITP